MNGERIIINEVETRYMVYPDGSIISTNYNNTNQVKEIKHHINHGGYHLVFLHVKGKIYSYQVHRLVASYFIENPNNLPQVNHKNGNKDNNDVSNLEWATAKENIQHALDHGLIKTCEDSVHSTITNKDAEMICKMLEDNKLTIKEIAISVGTTVHIVRDILRRKTWKKISKMYKISNYTIKDTPGAKGERNSLATIDMITAKLICSMIESNRWALSEISEILGVSYKVIQHIYNGSSWAFLSKDYDFSKYDMLYHKKRRLKKNK